MRIIECLQILLSIGVCIYSSGTDLKRGTIANKILFLAVLPSLLLNICYYGFFARDLTGIYLINLLAIAILAILFYGIHIWGGGDSKMLIFLAFSLPARLYYYYGNEAFPLLSLVVFIFSFGYIYLIFHSLICAIRKEESFQVSFNRSTISVFIKDYVIASIYLSLLLKIIYLAIPEFYLENQTLFLFLNVFAVMMICDIPLFRRIWLLVGCAIAGSGLAIYSRSFLSIENLWIYPVIAILFVFRQLIARYNYKLLQVSEIRPGMILSAANVALMSSSKIANLPTGTSEDLKSKLTEENVAAIKTWYTTQKNYQVVTIVRKIPFAIFISFGYCLFVILGLIQ